MEMLDLVQFTGTEEYYRHFMGIVYTDGVHYLMENGAAWVIDAIASYQGSPKLRKGMLAEFQLWELRVDLEEKTGLLTCKADSDCPPVIMQRFEFTDFPLAELKLYVEASGSSRVCMLPSER